MAIRGNPKSTVSVAPMKLRPEDRITRKLNVFSDDFEIVNYKNKMRITTHFYPATWQHVLLYAVLYAFTIFAIKVVWFEHFGKPQLFFVDEAHGGDVSLDEHAQQTTP